MANDMSEPATRADVNYLAELVTKNMNSIESLSNGFDRLEDRFDRLENQFYDFKREIKSEFAELKTIMKGSVKVLNNHEERIQVLETTAA